jgi:uncharacterized protein (TIGR02284 family)
MNTDVQTIRDLIETTVDSADGYEEAAREAGNSRFKSLFGSRAAERREVVRQLQQLVEWEGDEPDGSLLAAAHRGFMDLRQALSRGDQAVIEEVERGEDYIKARYERALENAELSSQARTAVLRAYGAVRAAHDQVRDLKRAHAGDGGRTGGAGPRAAG